VREGYDRVIVAATPQRLELGEEFTVLPPHVRLFDWMELPESFTPRLRNIIDLSFQDEDSMLDTRLGFRSWRYRGERARHVKNIDKKQWFAIHALAKSFGQLDRPSDRELAAVQPRFVPIGRDLPPRGPIELSSVALFSSRQDRELPVVVEAVKHLRASRDQEAA